MPSEFDSEKRPWLKVAVATGVIFAAVGLVFFGPMASKKKIPAPTEEITVGQPQQAARGDGSIKASLIDTSSSPIPTLVFSWKTDWMRVTLLASAADAAKIQSEPLGSGGLRLKGVLPGVDVEYSKGKDVVKEDIIIQNRDAVTASATGPSFSYALKFLGAQPAKNKDGSFKPYVFNSGGKYAFHIAEPTMSDADGRTSKDLTATMRRTRPSDSWYDHDADPYAQFTLTITPSQKWLLNEYRSYPVRIDPAVIRDESSLAE